MTTRSIGGTSRKIEAFRQGAVGADLWPNCTTTTVRMSLGRLASNRNDGSDPNLIFGAVSQSKERLQCMAFAVHSSITFRGGCRDQTTSPLKNVSSLRLNRCDAKRLKWRMGSKLCHTAGHIGPYGGRGHHSRYISMQPHVHLHDHVLCPIQTLCCRTEEYS